MRILYVCDLNSVHSQKWIKFFIDRDHDVSIYSTSPHPGSFHGAKVYGDTLDRRHAETAGSANVARSAVLSMPLLAGQIERGFRIYRPLRVLLDTKRHVRRLNQVVATVNPDLIHCLRIPNEGFIGASLDSKAALVISIWGNDLTYWANLPFFRTPTEKALNRCDLLFSDCEKDIRLGHSYGYETGKPFLVVPGAGGMLPADLEEGRHSLTARTDYFKEKLKIDGQPVILSLRGFGSQGQEVDNVPLLKASRTLMEKGTGFKLVIAGKRNGFRFNKLSKLVERYGLGKNVYLVDQFTHSEALMALRGADFSISVAKHDGTPNSMLEAMTFGAIPVMSDIASIREWITDGVNGYLFDPGDPVSIGETIERCLSDKGKHDAMRSRNYELIMKRADYFVNMTKTEKYLSSFLEKRVL